MSVEDAVARLRAKLGGEPPTLVAVAGPNGAGKSTFYDIYLAPLRLPFVNADLIAATLSHDDPVSLAREASATAARERGFLVERRESFCMETVFSDPVGDKIGFLRDARNRGYYVVLVFIGIASPELSEARVASRTLAGGHGVPRDRLYGRFPRTLVNLRAAIRHVDLCYLFDNSSVDRPFRPIARWEDGRRVWRGRLRPSWVPRPLLV